jgi:hypothetical protein
MKRLLIGTGGLILLVLAAVPALAQERPKAGDPQYSTTISPGEVTPTPEMWFYQQYQREYRDPKTAVRQKAEFRAAQRQHRLACLKWFGYSNSRPLVCGDPMHGDWSPSWKSNNYYYPDRWQGVGGPWLVIRPPRSDWSIY